MSILKSLACATSALALVLGSVAQAETWRWKDAAGQVHFGDRPPAGVAAERIDKPAKPPALSDEERTRRQQALRAREAQREAAAENEAARAARDEQDAAGAAAMNRGRCDRARWALAALESERPVYRDGNGAYRIKRPPNQPDTYTGPREYVEDTERQLEIARYQADMDRYCADFPELQDKALAEEDLRHAEACEFAAAELEQLEQGDSRATPDELASRRRFLDEECQ